MDQYGAPLWNGTIVVSAPATNNTVQLSIPEEAVFLGIFYKSKKAGTSARFLWADFCSVPPYLSQINVNPPDAYPLTVSSLTFDLAYSSGNEQQDVQLLVDSFLVAGEPVDPPPGVALSGHYDLNVDLPEQVGSADPAELTMTVAHAEEILEFQLWVDGVLLADQTSPGATLEHSSHKGVGRVSVPFDLSAVVSTKATVVAAFRTAGGWSDSNRSVVSIR